VSPAPVLTFGAADALVLLPPCRTPPLPRVPDPLGTFREARPDPADVVGVVDDDAGFVVVDGAEPDVVVVLDGAEPDVVVVVVEGRIVSAETACPEAQFTAPPPTARHVLPET
jgi:hypothetical protein